MSTDARIPTPADHRDYLRTDDDLFDTVAAEIATGVEGFRTVPDRRHKQATENTLEFMEGWMQPLMAQVWRDGHNAAARGDDTCPYPTAG